MNGSKTSAAALALAVLAGSALAGCGGLPHRSGRLEESLPERPPVDAMAQAQLEAGRAALAAGDYGNAISAFRNARLSPDHAAQAYNGMGIAYSYIGRPDLAGRFFREAMARDPADPRFGANLARLQRQLDARAAQQAFAARSAEPARPAGLHGPVSASFAIGNTSISTFAPGNRRGVIRIELPAARLVRVSNREFRIKDMRRPAYPARVALAGTRPR